MRGGYFAGSYRLIGLLRARILGQSIAGLSGRLPKIIGACANPVVDALVLGEEAGYGVMGDDAGAGLGEDVFDGSVVDDLADVGFV